MAAQGVSDKVIPLKSGDSSYGSGQPSQRPIFWLISREIVNNSIDAGGVRDSNLQILDRPRFRAVW